MDFKRYKWEAADVTRSLAVAYDLARASQKLIIGKDDGPGDPKLLVSEKQEYAPLTTQVCGLQFSLQSNSIFRTVLKDDVPINKGGGVPAISAEVIDLEHHLSIQMVMANYRLLEEYESDLYREFLIENVGQLINKNDLCKTIEESDFDKGEHKYLSVRCINRLVRNYGSKSPQQRMKQWNKCGMEPLDEEELDLFRLLNHRRNHLAHESNAIKSNLILADHYYECCRLIAQRLGAAAQDSDAIKFDGDNLKAFRENLAESIEILKRSLPVTCW